MTFAIKTKERPKLIRFEEERTIKNKISSWSRQRGTSPDECPEYDIQQYDGKVPVIWSTPSLPSLPGRVLPGDVAPDRVQSMV